MIVPRHINRLLHTDGFGQEELGDHRGRECGQGIAAQMLPIADPHRFGELEPLRPECFFRELDAVKRGVIWTKFKIERNLLFKLRDNN